MMRGDVGSPGGVGSGPREDGPGSELEGASACGGGSLLN